jgi:hypothetical protein
MSAHSAFIPYWQQGWIFIYLKGGVEIFLVGCKRHHSVSFRKKNLFAKQNLIGAQTHRQTDIKTDTFTTYARILKAHSHSLKSGLTHTHSGADLA